MAEEDKTTYSNVLDELEAIQKEIEATYKNIPYRPEGVQSVKPKEQNKEEPEPKPRSNSRSAFKPLVSTPSLSHFLKNEDWQKVSAHHFAKEGNLEGLEQILGLNKDVINDHANFNEQTPLHVALEFNKIETASFLIGKGASLTLKDKIGRTPFHYAARYGSELMVKMLIDSGADVNAVDCYGETALHIAAIHGFIDTASYLLKHTSIDVNIQNTFKETALHKAARSGDFDIAKLLVEHNAKILSGFQGKPYDVCAPENEDLIQLLKEAEEKENQNEASEDLFPSQLPLTDRHTRMLMSLQKSTDVRSLSLEELDKQIQEIIQRAESETSEKPSSPKPRSETFSTMNENSIIEKSRTEDIIVTKNSSSLPEVQLEGFHEPFRTDFFRTPHLVFATESLLHHDENPNDKDSAIMLVKKIPVNDIHEALLISKWGYSKVIILEHDLSTETKPLEEKIREYLDDKSKPKKIASSPHDKHEKTKAQRFMQLLSSTKNATLHRHHSLENNKGHGGWWHVSGKSISLELLGLEVQLGRGKCYSFGVVYSTAGQEDEAEMFKNKMSPSFEKFLGILGSKIETKGWSGYSGGFDPACDSYTTWYTSWRGFEIMFHVAPNLTPEDQRRHIGNDKVIIYFHEKTKFVPNSFRGNVNSVGIVVQPDSDGYRLGAFARSRVKMFHPNLPNFPLTDKEQLKDILMTTAINAVDAIEKSPPYVFLYANVWKDAIEDLLKRFPPKSMKHSHSHSQVSK